ncbi:manganese efflux pump MntP [Intestinibacter sp.]|uniref:manganese efflux pump MntP n=1 Tax=Intestinibacter sp. TaxID=1965304 RepID=UPI002A76380E|nr:manganese efflux pump MntP family protein [Intestinibacter sp.]MDY2735850.1 manganese efflux pump MntP family protein [Intestinibacter sp.]MDY4574924.1 manganese efflux pump MntP family protein [Intestinibacter sp.]
MSLINIFLTGFALSMDAFAVSVSKGMTLKNINSKLAFKIAFFFGFFQGFMPFIGWFLGIKFESYIKSVDHWIALFLLSFIGLKMIFEAVETETIKFKDEAEKQKYIESINTIDNREIFILSIATSIDALAVGVSFAFLSISIFPVCFSIFAITLSLCFIGVLIGKKLGGVFKNYAQILGGIILIFIGLNILNEHTGFLSKIFG